MKRGIASQFFLAFTGIMILTLGVLGTVFMYFTNNYFVNESRQILMQTAQTSLSAMNTFIKEDSVKADDLLYNLFVISSSTDSLVHIYNTQDEGLVCSSNSSCEIIENRQAGVDFLTSLQEEGEGITFEMVLSENEETDSYMLMYDIINSNKEHIGFVRVSSKSDTISLFLESLTAIFIFAAGFVLIIANAVSFFLTSRIINPIEKVSDAAKEFSLGNFSARVDVKKGAAEITQLSETFNAMASFVENNEESQSNFIANISHELRTPMTSIKGFIDGILDGTIQTNEQDKYLKIVSDEIGRLARLTNSMLEMSKAQEENYEYNMATYDIWDTISTIVLGHESEVEEKNITIKGFEPQPLNIYTDADIVHQIIYNIYNNAVKFTPKNGEILLDVKKPKAQDNVVIRIRNTGEGIPKKDIPYIFERFYKSDKSRSINKKGAGIGLFIVQTLLTKIGGKIEVKSVVSRYTEFIVTLPMNQNMMAQNTSSKK